MLFNEKKNDPFFGLKLNLIDLRFDFFKNGRRKKKKTTTRIEKW
jgi:hypothetical protein